MTDLFTHARFEPFLNKPFSVDLGEQTLELLLTEVEVGKEHEALPRTPFSLIFTGPGSPLIGQGTYGLNQDELGQIELFLVPVASLGEGQQYQAVFN